MTLAYWCVLAGGLLPLAWVGVAKYNPKLGPYNNKAPRDYLSKATGYHQRAKWAEANALEAFPIFAAAIIIAHLRGMDQNTLNMVALIWIAARVLHGVLYIADYDKLRSLAWTVGIGCVIALFAL